MKQALRPGRSRVEEREALQRAAKQAMPLVLEGLLEYPALADEMLALAWELAVPRPIVISFTSQRADDRPLPIARRPGPQTGSAARGVSRGVTSRGTPGRARRVGQTIGPQAQGRVPVPVQLQTAGLAAEDPLGEGHPPLGAAPGGGEASWDHHQGRPVPPRLVLQHPQERPPPHVGHRPGQKALG